MFKKFTLLIAIFLILGTLGQLNFATKQQIYITINSETVTFSGEYGNPYIENERTMVPLRFVAENLGAKVHWIQETRSVLIEKQGMVILLQVGSSDIIVNGIRKEMDTKMVFNLKEERNYVPLRFVSENLGADVGWEREGNIYFISIVDEIGKEEPIKEEATKEDTTAEEVISGFYGLNIGDTEDKVLNTLGKPARKDLTPYDYTWWIYNQDYANYLQVGIRDNKVVTLYSNSNNWDYKGLHLGLHIEEAKKKFSFDNSIDLVYDKADFILNISGGLKGERYLAIDEEIAIEIYIDIHNNDTITSIRLNDLTSLLATGSHGYSWSSIHGRPQFLPNPITEEQQQEVNRGNEKQLLDLVNSIRFRKGLNTLEWHQAIADVAYGHSVDMNKNGFFDHVSPTNGTVADRVNKANINHRGVGENIAYGYADAISAQEALMNSYGHRVNIINTRYTGIGTGAYERYYTQKFIIE